MATTTLDRPTPSPSSEPTSPAVPASAVPAPTVPEPVIPTPDPAVAPVVPPTVADVHQAIAEVVLAAGLATTAIVTHHVSRLAVGACELWWSGFARSAPTTA